MAPRVTFVVDADGDVGDDGKPQPEGPFLATFPAPAPPPADLAFQVYKPAVRPGDVLPRRQAKKRVVAAETDHVEFEGKNYGEEAASWACNCRYLVGVYDPRTREVRLREAPVLQMHRTVKRLKVAKIIEGDVEGEANEYSEARRALGESFGSKKARTSLRAVERNEVDVGQLQGVAGFIAEQIEENSVGMPTKEEIKASMDEDRPIPPYNAQAARPNEVYARDGIVPFDELKIVPIKSITEATSKEQMISCLPFQTSSFINDRIQQAVASPKDVSRLRELVYLAILMRFRTVRVKDVNVDTLKKLLRNPPAAIISGLLKRFTETTVDGKQQSHKITPRSKDKATNYALALALRIDDYSVDPAPLAADMEIGPIKITEHLRSLGCRVEAVGRSASEAFGVSAAEAKAKRMRRAVLAVPLSFPEPRKYRKA